MTDFYYIMKKIAVVTTVKKNLQFIGYPLKFNKKWVTI